MNKCSGSADVPEPPSTAGTVLTAGAAPTQTGRKHHWPEMGAVCRGRQPPGLWGDQSPRVLSDGVLTGGERQGESLCIRSSC